MFIYSFCRIVNLLWSLLDQLILPHQAPVSGWKGTWKSDLQTCEVISGVFFLHLGRWFLGVFFCTLEGDFWGCFYCTLEGDFLGCFFAPWKEVNEDLTDPGSHLVRCRGAEVDVEHPYGHQWSCDHGWHIHVIMNAIMTPTSWGWGWLWRGK